MSEADGSNHSTTKVYLRSDIVSYIIIVREWDHFITTVELLIIA